MARRSRDDAVAHTLAFVVGLALFTGTLGLLLASSAQSPGPDDQGTRQAAHRVDAESVADVLFASPGIGWSAGPDNVTRLGLLHDDGTRLDAARLDALRGATYGADPGNGRVDYEEALDGLGLPTDGSLGIHLRMTPVGLQEALQGADLGHVRTAYLADADPLPNNLTVLHTTDALMIADARAQVEAYLDDARTERDVVLALDAGYDDDVNLWGLDVDAYDPVLDTRTPLGDAVSDPSLLDGDVYLDDKQYLSRTQDSGDGLLEERLGGYDLLVVGSTLDHAALTAESVKRPIADWVEAGGTLMVLGSDSQNYQWLQPLFAVGTTTVNAAPAAPDVGHPMLRQPWSLDWPSYDDFGLGWDLKENGAQSTQDQFQHVITSDEDAILAVSNEGAFGDGRVFLTSYRAGAIADGSGPDEAMHLLENMVLYSDRSHLYLDYGPTPPADAAVSAAVRTTQLFDDDLGMVNVRVTVLHWGA